jgi:hypothetical protein
MTAVQLPCNFTPHTHFEELGPQTKKPHLIPYVEHSMFNDFETYGWIMRFTKVIGAYFE